MHSIIPLLIGWGLDLCAGDPARLPHPIVAFGRWISFFERKANHGDHRRAEILMILTGVLLYLL